MTDELRGFTPATFELFQALAENNRTDWFQAHREEYEQAVLIPVQQLVVQLGDALRHTLPGLRYDPRADGRGSLMRIHRDVRFSRDKSPLNTHLAAILWLGEGKKTEHPGFGFMVDVSGVQIMAGWHVFSPPVLARFREAVLDDARGAELQRILDKAVNQPPLEIGGELYARTPAGVNANHPRESLLRRKGLYLTRPGIPASEASDPAVSQSILSVFQAGAPLCTWLAHLG